MSRHNRLRRKWRCTKCQAGMHRELAAPAQVAATKAKVTERLVHICGRCKTCHYDEGETIRALSPVELFSLHLAFPQAMAQIERTVYPPSRTPAGTLTIADAEK